MIGAQPFSVNIEGAEIGTMGTMKKLKWSLFVVGGLLGLALIVPWLIPTSSYVAQIENAAAMKLGEPVRLAGLRFALLPLPSATLDKLTIGKDQAVHIGSITVHPDIFSLLSDVKVIRSVEVSGLRVNEALLARVPIWAKPSPDAAPRTLTVRRVVLREVGIALKTLQWGPLQADIQLSESGLSTVAAGMADGSLGIRLVPEGEAFKVTLTGRDFVLPVGPALQFDILDGTGVLSKSGLDLGVFNGRLYGGNLQAPIRLDWGKGWNVRGSLQIEGIDIAGMMKAMKRAATVGGRLHGRGNYTMAAMRPGNLADGMNGGFSFEVRQGVLHNVDLAKAATSLSKAGMRGGQTEFDELATQLDVVGRLYKLRDIRVSSGLLKATGNIDVTPQKALAGKVAVEMKGTASLVAIPLKVAGTLQHPVLLPDGAALAGAATGTMMLGPGFGTAIGSKAGQALESLFK